MERCGFDGKLARAHFSTPATVASARTNHAARSYRRDGSNTYDLMHPRCLFPLDRACAQKAHCPLSRSCVAKREQAMAQMGRAKWSPPYRHSRSNRTPRRPTVCGATPSGVPPAVVFEARRGQTLFARDPRPSTSTRPEESASAYLSETSAHTSPVEALTCIFIRGPSKKK